MSAFHFRLERLRRVREIEEKLAREEWLVAQNAARAALALAEEKRLAVEHALAMLREKQTEPSISPTEILVEHAHLESLRRARGTAQLAARARAVEAERLFVAWKARDAAKLGLERLEERARDAHTQAENHKETRAMDEVASIRAARAARVSALAARLRAASAGDRPRARLGH